MRRTGFIIIILCVCMGIVPLAVNAQPDSFKDPEAFNAPQNLNLPKNSNHLEFAPGPAFSNLYTEQKPAQELEPETEFNFVIRDESRLIPCRSRS